MTEGQKLELLKLNEKILNLLKLCDDTFSVGGCINRESLINTQKTIIEALLSKSDVGVLLNYEIQLESDLATLEIVKSHLKQQAKKLNYEYKL